MKGLKEMDAYHASELRKAATSRGHQSGKGPKFRSDSAAAIRKLRKLQTEILSEYGLTNREIEVALHLLCGISYAHIAKVLLVTESTVRFHTHNLLKKCKVKSRFDLSYMVLIRLHFE